MTAWAEGVSATTQYELESGRVLTATAGELSTSYLYGMGPVAELTDSWAYSLPDGTNTQRQLTDSAGEVSQISSYTPWGDTLTSYGDGNFTYGYFGGIMDNATGLLYVGNGQYYDPATGRFLNRNARPDQSNPYVPWKSDPSGAMISPLILLALVFANKKKRGKWDNLVILLVVGMALGMGLSACGQSGVPSEEDGNVYAKIDSLPYPVALFFVQDEHIVEYYVSPGDPALNLPTMNCWITIKSNIPDDFQDPIIQSIGKKPYTQLIDSKLNGNPDPITHVSAKEVYKLYVDMWKADINKWWWIVFGSDNDYSIWDFISTMSYFEASKQTRFALTMAEAGVRFYYGRFGKNTIPDSSPEAIINWWTAFSQSTAGPVKGGVDSIKKETASDIIEMSIIGLNFQATPAYWKKWDYYAPYDWGNLYAENYDPITDIDPKTVYKNNTHALYILWGSPTDLAQNKSFVVPSGCLWKKAHPEPYNKDGWSKEVCPSVKRVN